MVIKDFRTKLIRGLAFIVIASLVTLITVPSNVQAGLTAGWSSSATLIQTNAGFSTDPQVAMDDNGNAVSVWEQWDGAHFSIYANRCFVGAWGTASVIGNGVGNAQHPQVAMDDNGNAMVVWGQLDVSDWHIYANRYTAGSWGTASVIGNGVGDPLKGPHVAMDERGNAMAVWNQGDVHSMNIYANQYSAGAWGTPSVIGNGVGYANDQQVAMDDNGNAMVVWGQLDVSDWHIYANRYTAGSWGTASVIGNGMTACVAMDERGNAMAVWYNSNYSTSISSVYGNRYSSGSWGTASVIGNGVNIAGSYVAMDNEGDAMAIWNQWNGSISSVYANSYSNGSWGTAFPIGNGAGSAWDSHVAMDERGNAMAVWNQGDGPNDRIYANRYTAGSWGIATPIENGIGVAQSPKVAMDSYGNTIAVWFRGDGPSWSIKANIYVAEQNVTITSPTTGSSLNTPTVLVTGASTPGAGLVVNGIVVFVASNGSYSAVIPLLEGANRITATATNGVWHTVGSASISVSCVNDERDAVIILRDSLNSSNLNASLANENQTRLDAYNSALSASLNQTIDDLGTTRANLKEVQTDLVAEQNVRSANGTTYLLMGLVGIVLAILAFILVFIRRRAPKNP